MNRYPAENPNASRPRRILHVFALLAVAVIAVAGCAHLGASKPKIGQVFQDCPTCPQMVMLPAGSVMVGAGADEHAREGATPEMIARETPAHRVTLAKPFAVGRYEVTRGEFAAFVKATARDQRGCTVMGAGVRGYVNDPAKSYLDPGYVQTDRHPVVCVNWHDAKAYVAWLSAQTGATYRLLSEGEWEYAARGGSTTARWWGDGREGACEYANVQALDRFPAASASANPESYFQCRDGYENTAPVGSFKTNGFGLYDIHGNVWEWTEDCYDGDRQTAHADGSPHRDGGCEGHMDRGASWQNSPRYLRAAARHKDVADQRNLILGFRVAREVD